VVLSFGLPDGTRRARLERATDPLLFSANPGGTGVSEKVYEWAFEGGSSDAVFEIGDLPPHSGNWWYRLAAWGDFGESISIDGPVFVDRSSIRRLSVSIGPNPWGGTGPVRVFLAGHDGEGRRDELGERVAQSPSSEGTVALFDVTGRRIAEIPRVNTGSNDSLQLRGEIGSTRGVATGDPTSESIPEEFIEAIEWTPRDRAGRPLASGVYYLRWLDSLARERAQARWVVLR
jgi:hypothetical protein